MKKREHFVDIFVDGVMPSSHDIRVAFVKFSVIRCNIFQNKVSPYRLDISARKAVHFMILPTKVTKFAMKEFWILI